MSHEAPDLEKFLTGENADAIRKIEYLASPYWHTPTGRPEGPGPGRRRPPPRS